MSDPALTPEADRELLVVYPDRGAAEAARRALLEVGVREDAIHLDEEPDVVASLRSEMREELSRAWVVPNAGVVYPKEAARGLLGVSALAGGIGLLAAVPLALIDFGSTYWIRLAIWAAVGLAFGFAIGMVVGPATAAPRPNEPPAARRGVLLRVEQDSPQLRSLLATDDVVRMDEITHAGDPVDTVTTEGDRSVVDTAVETAKDVAANASSDDYHRER